MYALSMPTILDIWEQGYSQHPIDRALTMLSPVFPGKTRDELAIFSLGLRDEHLFKVREANFGHKLVGTSLCPRCNEKLEFSIDTGTILTSVHSHTVDKQFSVCIDHYFIDYRLPNSHDLAHVVKCGNLKEGRKLLLERCIVKLTYREKRVAPAELPANITERFGEEIERADPHAETILDLTCLECEYDWSAPLDIGLFLWTEITARARRFLQDVHLLALAYGWSEPEILKLSAFRRNQYLEMIG